MPQKTYTTTEISKLFDVDKTTVAKWIDNGKLKAFKTPGGHRRVVEEELVRVLEQYHIPVPHTMKVRKRNILVICKDQKKSSALEPVRKLVNANKEVYTLNVQSNPFIGLVEIGKNLPDLLVFDWEVADNMYNDLTEVVKYLHSNNIDKQIRTLIVSTDPDAEIEKKTRSLGVDHYYHRQQLSPDALENVMQRGGNS